METITCKLEDLLINFDSKRIPLSSVEREKRKGPYPYYGATKIFDYVDDYLFDGDYILLGEDGTVMNEDGTPVLQRPSGKFWVNNHAHVLRNTDLVDFDYLYYLLRSTNFRPYVTGAVQPKISQKNLNSIVVTIPKDLEKQKRIASLLKVFDDKINNNILICKNLEKQLKAIFEKEFVDFEGSVEKFVPSKIGREVPESFKIVRITDIPHILETGKRPKGGAVKNGIPSVGAESVKGLGNFDFSSIKYVPEEFAQKMKRGKIEGYELLIYKDGGKPGTFIPHFSMFGEGYPFDNFYINEHVFKLDFGNKGFNIFCYYYFQTKYVYNWLANNGGKAAVPGINTQDIENIYIFDPADERVQSFCVIAVPVFEKILKTYKKNQILQDMMKLLVPKVISGEIDLENIEL